MQLVKYIFTFLIAFLIGFVIFAPKEKLYYLLEDRLQKEGFIIAKEEIVTTPTTILIKHPKLYYQGANIATALDIKLQTLLFYNKLTLEGFEPQSILKDQFPIEIKDATALYTILNPLKVIIKAKGNFGEIEGYYNIKEKLIHLDITKPKDLAPIKPLLKKGKKGWYYEQRF
ncbi:MAG: hypothetical protein GXO02_06110 [Epsilonproteobacteria bacterium]|nr:hypothetical protein [Campylobacterota bacterium]